MSITKKMTGWLATVGLLVSALIASAGAHASIFTDILDPGAPFFFNSFSLKGNNGNWNLTHKGGFTFDETIGNGGDHVGEDGSYRLSAKFNRTTGAFDSGSVSLKGAIPSLGITSKNTVLFTADLTGFDFISDYLGSEKTLAAFRTENLAGEICNLFSCTPEESIFLEFNGMFTSPSDTIRLNGDATTTIPLPAALWLFGSGLVALGAIARRRNDKVTA